MITYHGGKNRLAAYADAWKNQHTINGLQPHIGAQAIAKLMAFKASERKDDPTRLHGIHGPYEEGALRQTGRLPDGYYEDGDPEPWSLRRKESESNLLFQLFYWPPGGAYNAYGADYFGVVLAQSTLSDQDYAKEVRKINKNWGDFLEQAGIRGEHAHSIIGQEYNRMSCTACSMLTAMACRDAGLLDLFGAFLSASPAQRFQTLEEMGLAPLLRMTLPDPNPTLIMKGQQP